ncbi:MAG: ribonuclease III [Flavobacteriales bacterium]|nr:ribonuclease III [Flavobacteriales bacterium]|tara:strand:+ start:7923 stop:8621 length:699 start_codon:yes stop_codon:yes gene_type:complete
MNLFTFFKQTLISKTSQEKQLFKILGFYPKNINLYLEALTHKSVRGRLAHNERLEFLGDAVFGSVVAEFVFREFPNEDEGFLTQTRSKIVGRNTLNNLANQINLNSLLKHKVASNRHIFGNALEALIGAIFLDQGYHVTAKYIIEKLIKTNLDIHKLAKEISNHKGKLLEWGQAKKKQVIFKLISSSGKDHEKSYRVMVMIGQKKCSEADGTSIKRAEELAAKLALKELALS